MDGKPEYDKELNLINTPLENLRSILSEADASVQAVTDASSKDQPAKSLTTVNRSEIEQMIARLKADSQQFLSPQALNRTLNLMAKDKAPGCLSESALQNKHIHNLDRLLNENLTGH